MEYKVAWENVPPCVPYPYSVNSFWFPPNSLTAFSLNPFIPTQNEAVIP